MRISASVLLLGAMSSFAVMIDQIALTVGNQAITQSEITREIRLAALLNGDKPDYAAASRRLAADRLLEQALVRREMTFGSYPTVPAAQVNESFASTEKARGGPAELDRTLREYALTRDDLRSYLEWQIALLKFIDLRFRPSVQVTREDVTTYYQANLDALPKVNGKPPDLHDIRAQIEQKLTGERVDQQVDQWIKDSRAHTIIRYVDPALIDGPVAPPTQVDVAPH